ncbi:SOS response-associated peptidase [Azospirillum sp. B4]|uniref:SOS response-associated peptidase n=1 Tax=Azospirillum sp. B4 TaxID=95605 RepID=UPI00034BC47F|nr:SOS response-associated peptidase [Azospirillum sp. B4]
MCGRYAVTTTPEGLKHLFGVTNDLVNYPARYNVAPTTRNPVVRLNPDTGARSMDLLRWGLVPHWAKDMSAGAKAINARSETLAEKPTFRSALKKRRCIVPADAFYEWKKTSPTQKQPYAISLDDGQPMAFAGLWEGWREPATGDWVHTYTIITTTPNALMEPIHDRMPVILPAKSWSTWLGEQPATEPELLALLTPYPANGMRLWPVNGRVGKVGNDDAGLLDPIELGVGVAI